MEENIDTRDKNTGQATQKFWLVPYRTASRTGHGTRDIQISRAVPTPDLSFFAVGDDKMLVKFSRRLSCRVNQYSKPATGEFLVFVYKIKDQFVYVWRVKIRGAKKNLRQMDGKLTDNALLNR